MSYCTKCGSVLEDNAKFCSSCGTVVSSDPPSSAKGFRLDDYTFRYKAEDISQNQTLSIFAYFSWFVLIPLLAAQNSPYARFHSNQGLVLAIFWTGWWVIAGIVSGIFRWVAFGWLELFVSTLMGILNLPFLILMILGIVNAASGKARELPVIGKIRILK